MKKYEQLSYKEQLELFHNRGMKFDYSFNELDETLPVYLKSEKEDSANYTNRLAIVICIVVKLMSSINIRYRFGNLINALNHLLDETNTPEVYGFRDKKAIYECFSKERELIFKE